MCFWIEVSDGDQAWLEKTIPQNDGKKRGLLAPASKRYENFFKNVKVCDVVFSYLAKTLTLKKEWQSSIVGISTVVRPYYELRGTLYVETCNDLELPLPIKYASIRKKQGFSLKFQKMINASMQKYLIEISPVDFKKLIKIHMKNYVFLKNTEYNKYI